jgi:hypothetical protein
MSVDSANRLFFLDLLDSTTLLCNLGTIVHTCTTVQLQVALARHLQSCAGCIAGDSDAWLSISSLFFRTPMPDICPDSSPQRSTHGPPGVSFQLRKEDGLDHHHSWRSTRVRPLHHRGLAALLSVSDSRCDSVPMSVLTRTCFCLSPGDGLVVRCHGI